MSDLGPFVIDCVNIRPLSPYLSSQSKLHALTNVTDLSEKPSLCCFKSISDGRAVTSAVSTVKCAQMISRYVFFTHLWLMTVSLNATLITTKPSFFFFSSIIVFTFNFKYHCFFCSLTRNLWPWTRSLLLRTWCHWKRGEPAFRTNPTTLWTFGALWRTVLAKSYLRSRCLWVFLAAITTHDC